MWVQAFVYAETAKKAEDDGDFKRAAEFYQSAAVGFLEAIKAIGCVLNHL